MVPEITWTDAGPEQLEAWHGGRQWALLRRLKQPNGNRAGWYLHATEAPGVLADDGRFMHRRVGDAKERATATILANEAGESE